MKKLRIEIGGVYLMRNGHAAHVSGEEMWACKKPDGSPGAIHVWLGRCEKCNVKLFWQHDGHYDATGKNQHEFDILRKMPLPHHGATRLSIGSYHIKTDKGSEAILQRDGRSGFIIKIGRGSKHHRAKTLRDAVKIARDALGEAQVFEMEEDGPVPAPKKKPAPKMPKPSPVVCSPSLPFLGEDGH